MVSVDRTTESRMTSWQSNCQDDTTFACPNLMLPMRQRESDDEYLLWFAYDTAGRCTLLATTRNGATWDETRWIYDAATGLCSAKIYADGSQVAYSYTPDGLTLRTTYASGRWVENVYDSRRQVVGRISSDGSDDAAFERDEHGRLIASSNAAASISLALSDVGLATNELWTADDSSFVFNRDYDDQSRLSRLAIAGTDYEQNLGYADDGRLVIVSNSDAVVTYAYTPDCQDAGYTIRLANGNCFTRTVERDDYRRELVTIVSNAFNGTMIGALAYSHDALNRPVSRNDDSFSYNLRGEVTSAQIAGFAESHSYDDIGNSTLAATSSGTNTYVANHLNQYTSILRASVSPCETNTPTYDADGNLTSHTPFAYSYDSASRLISVSSNDTHLATYAYDAQGRRVRKTTPAATTTFFYDAWNLIEERIVYTNDATSTIHYYWGKDLSGSLQGAGGIGGLLYLKIDGSIYIPLCDANGNITKYLDANGNVVASYTYDAFGNLLQQTGDLADIFSFCSSTKYYEAESWLYCYGKRFYSPSLRRWLTRDPVEEQGGVNLYAFCGNGATYQVDAKGTSACCRNGKKKSCDKFYKWNGAVTTSSLTWGLGATFLIIDLKSNFVCMTCSSWRIHIKAVLLTASVGAPFSLTGSDLAFGNISPDQFVGSVGLLGAGVGAMSAVEASSLRIGKARSNSVGLVGGAELGASASYGWLVDFEMVEE